MHHQIHHIVNNQFHLLHHHHRQLLLSLYTTQISHLNMIFQYDVIEGFLSIIDKFEYTNLKIIFYGTSENIPIWNFHAYFK